MLLVVKDVAKHSLSYNYFNIKRVPLKQHPARIVSSIKNNVMTDLRIAKAMTL